MSEDEQKKAYHAGKNAARIDSLEKRTDNLESSLRWITRITVTILIAVIISGLKLFLG